MSIYVIRHGETAWNKSYLMQGRIDIPLDEEGINQAKKVKEEVDKIPFTMCFVSPLSRAKETAEILLENRGITPIIEPRLVEMAYGEYEGTSRSGEGYLKQREKIAYRYKNGESYLDVAGRVFPFLDELKRNYRDKDILLVCHGGVMRIIRAYFQDDIENDDFFFSIPENCKVVRFDFKERNIPLMECPD